MGCLPRATVIAGTQQAFKQHRILTSAFLQ